MSYNINNKSTSELWAVLDTEGNILYSRGGSSSKPKLMVYENKSLAERAVKSDYSKQLLKNIEYKIEKIYEK